MLYIGEDAVLPVKGVEDREVSVGVRPEGFILREDGPLHCRLSHVQVMGRDTTVISFNDALEGESVRSIISAENRIPEGTKTVNFALKPFKTHIFDKKTGERIYFGE